MTRPGAQWATCSFTSTGSKSKDKMWYRLLGLLRYFSHWKPTQLDMAGACVPGCGEDGVDERILGVLGAHEEHVLCKNTKRENKGWVDASSVSQICLPSSATYASHQSACRCHWPPGRSTGGGPLGKWSTCSPDSCGLPCHSKEAEGTKRKSEIFALDINVKKNKNKNNNQLI